MEQSFSILSNNLLDNLQSGEHLQISIGGEKSQFVRFSKSKVRQSGVIDDASLGITLIKNNRKCDGSFTLSGNSLIDEKLALTVFESKIPIVNPKRLAFILIELEKWNKSPLMIILYSSKFIL